MNVLDPIIQRRGTTGVCSFNLLNKMIKLSSECCRTEWLINIFLVSWFLSCFTQRDRHTLTITAGVPARFPPIAVKLKGATAAIKP